MGEEEGGDPERERFRFFEAVVATLNELASDGPVLLVIDNLHAADEPTLLLLRHVLRGVDDAKLGVVGMFIDTEVPAAHRLRAMLADLRAVHPVATVHLRGLSSAGVEELVRGWPNTPADLVPQLCRLTDGNPLFLDELLRQLGYREAEQAEEGEAPVPPNLSPTEAIRELVARRVPRLPEDVIYLLQAAAVAGTEFEAWVVAEAAELTPERQLDAFDRAEESRLLRRVGQEFLGRYAFTHTLVRDAIYGELLRGRRVRYHHEIAVATERVHADELDTYVNELAHHFSMGAALADADKATHYCRAAGERARSACWRSRRPRCISSAAWKWPSSSAPPPPRRAVTCSSPSPRPRIGRATVRRPTPTSNGRPRWRGPWAMPIVSRLPPCVPVR